MYSNRVRQIYGYAVCFLAIITVLICTGSIVNNAIDLASPSGAAGTFDGSLNSFEAWMGSRQLYAAPTGGVVDTASAATLRTRFDSLRASRIAAGAFRARKEFISSLLILIFAVSLFVTHWRWLQRVRDDAVTA